MSNLFSDQNAVQLHQRLSALERQNRRLRGWTLASAGLALAGVLGAAATVCDVVSAERFVLRDARGHERVRLTAYETGGPPQLAFLNEKGKEIFKLGVSEQGQGFLEVQNADGKPARSHFAVVDGCAVLEPMKQAACGAEKSEPFGM